VVTENFRCRKDVQLKKIGHPLLWWQIKFSPHRSMKLCWMATKEFQSPFDTPTKSHGDRNSSIGQEGKQGIKKIPKW
jgi:hypothetical protein